MCQYDTRTSTQLYLQATQPQQAHAARCILALAELTQVHGYCTTVTSYIYWYRTVQQVRWKGESAAPAEGAHTGAPRPYREGRKRTIMRTIRVN